MDHTVKAAYIAVVVDKFPARTESRAAKMPRRDLTPFLLPVSGDLPAGPNLEYDPAFTRLERLAEGKPEQRMGDQVIAAEEPDHRAVEALATELLARSKDLRLGVKLTMVWLKTDSVSGLAAGLELTRRLLETFGSGVHPENDSSDPDDPSRANVLAGLANDAMIDAVRSTPIVEAWDKKLRLGPFSLRDIAIAGGEVPATAGTTAPTTAAIAAAFEKVALETLANTAQSVKECAEHLVGIEAAFQAAGALAPDLTALSGVLSSIRKPLGAAMGRRTQAEASSTEGVAEGGTSVQITEKSSASQFGDLRSREDVVRLLDKICAYYAANEPASPVPLLLIRAKHLVTASFLDIVKNLAPSSLDHFAFLNSPGPPAEGSENA